GGRANLSQTSGSGAPRTLRLQPVADPAAMRLAEQLLTVGSDLFDAKQAHALAATFAEDGEIQMIDLDTGKFNVSETKGRADVESFYQSAFKDATTIDSENRVDFARFVLPHLLVI